MALTDTQRRLLNTAVMVWLERNGPTLPYATLVLATAAQKRGALLPIIAELKSVRQTHIANDSDAARIARVAGMQAEVDDWTAVEGEL